MTDFLLFIMIITLCIIVLVKLNEENHEEKNLKRIYSLSEEQTKKHVDNISNSVDVLNLEKKELHDFLLHYKRIMNHFHQSNMTCQKCLELVGKDKKDTLKTILCQTLCDENEEDRELFENY